MGVQGLPKASRRGVWCSRPGANMSRRHSNYYCCVSGGPTFIVNTLNSVVTLFSII